MDILRSWKYAQSAPPISAFDDVIEVAATVFKREWEVTKYGGFLARIKARLNGQRWDDPN